MQCKVGDLAHIKKALRPTNVGLVVRCKAYLGHYSRGEMIPLNGELWAAFDTDDYWLIENDYADVETQFGAARESYIMDSWLEPIKPKGELTGTTTKKKIEDNIDA